MVSNIASFMAFAATERILAVARAVIALRMFAPSHVKRAPINIAAAPMQMSMRLNARWFFLNVGVVSMGLCILLFAANYGYCVNSTYARAPKY